MNANELDKWIENSPYCERDPAVILLRQQQAEIEVLKAKTLTDIGYETVFDGENYTTKLVEPKLKTLTDEEILQLWTQKNTLGGAQNIVDFARAILKKASEK